MLGMSVAASAQQAVNVQQTDGTVISVSLDQLSRLSFSKDLQHICLERTDGGSHTVLLEELSRVSFGALNSQETSTPKSPSLNLKLGSPLEISASEILTSAVLYNAMGRRVATAVGNGHSSTLLITSHDLPSGVYIVSIETAGGTRQSRKIILK